MFLPTDFQQLNSDSDVLVLNNTQFLINQIKDRIIQEFAPKANDLNFGLQPNSLIKKYFKQINTQGIFNRVEWKFSLKPGIKCELLTRDDSNKQEGKLQIKVTLQFSSTLNPLKNKSNIDSENFDIKVSLDFCPESPENQDEQNSSDSYSSRSEEICLPTR